ncbi:hypothetical protein T459_30337 [Capsicum annuum]|uniref:Uncharacterized protein n=1 Tax=Capsicum annuum TaxID=4072 RepID=A0A2G2Y857_CAPAN|nr:hypothetical protein T459_30337 [Capsicum annuum]
MEPMTASVILAKLEAITCQWEVINKRLDHMSYEDQTLVVGTQVLVDPLDDEIDSPRENDLCPSGAGTDNLTKVPLPSDESIHTLVDPCEKQGESTLVYELPTTSEDDFDCGPLASRDGLYVYEDNSCEKEGDMCLEMPSTSSLCVSYVVHIPSRNFKTSIHDIFNSDKEGLLNFEDDTVGESESGQYLRPWLRLPFDPGLDSKSNPFQEGKDDISQMAILIFEDMIGGHHLKAQDLVTSRAQEYARNTRFEHKQGRVWMIARSIEDLRTHGFGQHLMGHDLVILIKGAITMEPMTASAILAKLEAITCQWEVINESLDHIGVPKEQVGYPNTRQDEDRSSCELRSKNVIPYTHMNIVAVLASIGVHESSFFDTLDIVRSYEDQTLVVGTQALVDPLDEKIDSRRENDLCPSGAGTYNLTKVPLPSDESIHILVDPCEKQSESTLVYEFPTTSEGEQNDQPGVDNLDFIEYLENSSCDCLCEDDFDCGPLASRDGLYVYEDNSCEKEGDMCLEMPSTSSLCVSYVVHIPSRNFKTSIHDIFNSDKEGLLNFEDDTVGESESGQYLRPWLRLPFDPGLDSKSNPFQEGKDDISQMAILIFEDMIGGHHLKAQDLVTPMAQEYARKTCFEHTQGRVWKIAWSIKDLRTHGFGQHLMGHDLVILIEDRCESFNTNVGLAQEQNDDGKNNMVRRKILVNLPSTFSLLPTTTTTSNLTKNICLTISPLPTPSYTISPQISLNPQNFQFSVMANIHYPIVALPFKENKHDQLSVCQNARSGKEIQSIHHKNLGKELYNLRKSLDEELRLRNC